MSAKSFKMRRIKHEPFTVCCAFKRLLKCHKNEKQTTYSPCTQNMRRINKAFHFATTFDRYTMHTGYAVPFFALPFSRMHAMCLPVQPPNPASTLTHSPGRPAPSPPAALGCLRAQALAFAPTFANSITRSVPP